MLGTLMRAGDVLDLFTLEEPEWGVTATAQRLGIGKSLAHEALATLTAIGLLQRVGHGRYRLGWRMMSLASVLLRTSALGTCARPIIRDLVGARGVAVSLVAWERGRIIYINRHQRRDGGCGSGPTAGTIVPADDSAPARVLLASRPDAEIAALWQRHGLRTRRPTLAALAADLTEVRRMGWAQDAPCGEAGAGVAAPIRDAGGDVAAALSVVPAGVCEGTELRRHVPLAVAAAAQISDAIRRR
jgi:DNA-binding IclR family transcriptional regulator